MGFTTLLTLLCAASASGRRPQNDANASKSPVELDDASLSGIYALVLESGADSVSALGTVDCDGAGGLSGTIRINALDPANPPARSLSESSLSGTYSLGDDGLGTAQVAFVDIDGVESPVGMVVTRLHGSSAATVDGSFLVPSNTDTDPGALQTFRMTSRDVNGFDDSSLSGKYSVVVTGGPNLGHAIGIITFDGEGGLTGELKANAPKDETARDLFDTPIMGTYSAEHHGFVDMHFTMEMMKDDIPFFPTTLLITESHGTRADNLRGNFEIPSPILAKLGLTSLVKLELSYLGPAAMAKTTQ